MEITLKRELYNKNTFGTLERAAMMLKKPLSIIRNKMQERGYCSEDGTPTPTAFADGLAMVVWKEYGCNNHRLIRTCFKPSQSELHRTYVKQECEWNLTIITGIFGPQKMENLVPSERIKPVPQMESNKTRVSNNDGDSTSLPTATFSKPMTRQEKIRKEKMRKKGEKIDWSHQEKCARRSLAKFGKQLERKKSTKEPKKKIVKVSEQEAKQIEISKPRLNPSWV